MIQPKNLRKRILIQVNKVTIVAPTDSLSNLSEEHT